VTRQRIPTALIVLAAAGAAFFVLPLIGLLQRAPWSTLAGEVGRPEVRQALWLSIQCSLGALAVAAVLGLPLAWVLAKVDFPGRSVVRALVTLPMVLPPVVGGVALLYAFGRHGFSGTILRDTIGVTLPFTKAGAVVAEAFVAMPFLVVATEAGLRQLDSRYEEAAATLGAGPWRRLVTVTLPMIAPSLAAGAALAWARALGEFGATITFAGNLPGRTQTLPLAVYVSLETRPASAIVLSLLLLAVSLVVLVGLRDRWLGAA
jgi:molybdate transport system permease protein